jgi:cell fate regulator YaaT (PSP1 superfamily)
MNVFDWLSNMDMPSVDKFDIAEVRFKNGRKEFYRNPEKLSLYTGDPVIVEVPNGHHLGYISMQGELVRLQMQKKKVANDGEIRKIYRLAHQKDLEKLEDVKKRELPTLYRTREIVRDLKLEMKLSDIEYQADNTKATFYYSADDRVDFRELIKLLATEFKIRVEMRQISLRQEAGRLGGIGVCGRELCCSTWLSDFKNVATSAARYQNLSLNPSKLSGQCGRLKCCLNYELETYMDALEDIPKVEGPLLTEKGDATLQKVDIFRKIMWFGFAEENTWYPLNVARVNEILHLNREGKKPADLEKDEEEEKVPLEVLNSDLQRMDQKFKDKSKKRKKKKRGGEGSGPDSHRGSGGDQRNQTRGGGEGQQPREPREGGDQRGGQQQSRREGQQRPNTNPARGEGQPRQQQPPQREGGDQRGGQQQNRREGQQPRQNRGGDQRNQQQNRGEGQPRQNREGDQPRPPREPREGGEQRGGQQQNRREGQQPRQNRGGDQRNQQQNRGAGQPRQNREGGESGGDGQQPRPPREGGEQRGPNPDGNQNKPPQNPNAE